MFWQVSKYLWDSYKRVRRGRRLKKFQTTDISNVLLTTNLGLAPMLSDLVAAYGHLKDVIDRDIIVRMTGTGKWSDSVLWNQYSIFHAVTERAVFYIKIPPPKHNWYEWGNPFEHLWELTPMSYFIDYLIPVGSFLSTLDALDGVQVQVGTLTRKYAYHATQKQPFNAGFEIDFPCSYHYESHVRSVLTSIPQAELPTYEPSYSHNRLMNALAALHIIRAGK